MNTPSRTLETLKEDVELEGYEPGTVEFERVLLAKQVAKCQEFQGVSECRNCPAFEHCPLAKKHMMNIKYGVNSGNDDSNSGQ